jgi:hypothetical protein
MMRFLRARGLSLAIVVLVMFLISTLQGGISWSIEEGPLRRLEPDILRIVVTGFYALRIVLLLVLVTLWMFNRKRALFRMIVAVNAFFTLALFVDVMSLIRVLGGLHEAAEALLIDAALMSASNMLIFSIWYWIIDPPGVDEELQTDAPWAFLFPQRGSSLPHYDSWSPRYVDYLYIGFTNNFAFSPTDALPLSRTAKLLMFLQGSISVVIVLAIAGGAINAIVQGT